ncbi:MAG: CoA transferase [Acholeplasmatales bacterium]|nr:CoA transferase [Acholeplasmatales bacterium]
MDKEEILLDKAYDAQRVYDYLAKLLDIKTTLPVTFIADKKTEKELTKNYLKENPFPHVVKFVLAGLRKKAVNKLFVEEKVLQTPVIAAVLSLCAEVASEIGELRGDYFDQDEIYTDISYSGLQAIRLYMANYTDKNFKKSRLESAIRVDNAINGSFYKYKASNDRYVSFHTYYQSQQQKLVKELKLNKPSEKFKLGTTKKDKKYLTEVVSKLDSFALEERAFECGACACVLRDREEWEATKVGQAVKEMPLIRFKDSYQKKKLDFGDELDRGPLTGIRVLDLTHIIAGPACTRILAEYGADVLLVRRGKFNQQEQAMLELDGWAGKDSIQLDLNKEEDLSKMKQLIKEAHVIVYSYQNSCFDKFGLSLEEIRLINPNIIYSNLMCFSDTEWVNRPGWAPLAEDITGLSIRNGSKEKPVNLNGVPLDYIPGFILALGTLIAIRNNLKDHTISDVTTSLTRGAMLLHEMTDLCAKKENPSEQTKVLTHGLSNAFNSSRIYVETKAIGTVGFPAPATYHTKYRHPEINMGFVDGRTGFKTHKRYL